MAREHWQREPEEHDYPAAVDYLSLLAGAELVVALVQKLRDGSIETRKAKDLLRASGLPLLPTANPHVARDLDKVQRGAKLSPVLLVRGELRWGRPLTIADGYHRICASWHIDEDAAIPCVIAGPG